MTRAGGRDPAHGRAFAAGLAPQEGQQRDPVKRGLGVDAEHLERGRQEVEHARCCAHQRLERLYGASGVDARPSPHNAFGQIRDLSRCPDRRRRIQDHDVPARTGFAFQDRPQDLRIAGGVTTPQLLGPSQCQPVFGRLDLEVANPACCEQRGATGPGRRQLVEAIRPVHHQGTHRTQLTQRLGER